MKEKMIMINVSSLPMHDHVILLLNSNRIKRTILYTKHAEKTFPFLPQSNFYRKKGENCF